MSDSGDTSLLDRFLNASERIKEQLSRQYGYSFKGVGEAKRYAEEHKNNVVCSNSRTLDALISLRNVIQHSHVIGGVPIATPRLDTVIAIETIADQVERAPSISRFMIKDPVTVHPLTTLAEASHLVISLSLSQIPVCDGDEYVGVLTTNALARWLGAAFERGQGDLLEERVVVSDVLAFAEPHEEVAFVRPTYLASKACNRLTEDQPPVALLVTSDGGRSGRIQGIVTRFDVPNMLNQLSVRFPG